MKTREEFISTLANAHTCYGLKRNKDNFLMAVMTGYFDESGTHEDDNLCVVAGFVGNDAQWQAFANDWIPAIRPRKNLHMKDLPWKRKPTQTASLLSKLGPIPHRYNLTPVTVSLFWNDYRKSGLGTMSKLTGAYVICAVTCMCVTLGEVIGEDDIYFLFDRQRGVRKQAIETIRDFSFGLCGVDVRVKGTEFMKRTDTVCLDPADYLAYVVRARGIDGRSFKATAGQPIMGTRGHGGRLTSQDLEFWANEWRTTRSPLEILDDLKKWKFFRGPK